MLTAREIDMLRQIISLAGSLIASAHPDAGRSAGKSAKSEAKSGAGAEAEGKRRRRTGKELAAFRKMLVAERKRGVPVAELAKKHGISAAYIYQL
jgi:DNA invertase Pin-like site-specific DNA recombinase